MKRAENQIRESQLNKAKEFIENSELDEGTKFFRLTMLDVLASMNHSLNGQMDERIKGIVEKEMSFLIAVKQIGGFLLSNYKALTAWSVLLFSLFHGETLMKMMGMG